MVYMKPGDAKYTDVNGDHAYTPPTIACRSETVRQKLLFRFYQ